MVRRSLCPWGLTFFGLTSKIASQIRVNLFSVLHQIVFYGKGGYDFSTIYNMPIWLRKFIYNEITKFYKKEKEEYEQANSGNNSQTLIDSSGKVNPSNFPQFSGKSTPRTSYK